nr:MAG TPA: hypothetical protein [Herelleviridae sp.]
MGGFILLSFRWKIPISHFILLSKESIMTEEQVKALRKYDIMGSYYDTDSRTLICATNHGQLQLRRDLQIEFCCMDVGGLVVYIHRQTFRACKFNRQGAILGQYCSKGYPWRAEAPSLSLTDVLNAVEKDDSWKVPQRIVKRYLVQLIFQREKLGRGHLLQLQSILDSWREPIKTK